MQIKHKLWIFGLRTLQEVRHAFEAGSCVVQCGADSIAGDPLGNANLTPADVGGCVKQILSWQLPTIFLGGGKCGGSSISIQPVNNVCCAQISSTGGYNFVNAAKFWTYLTAVICGIDDQLDNDIPDNRHFLQFGPNYELSVPARQLVDKNTEDDMRTIFETIQSKRFLLRRNN